MSRFYTEKEKLKAVRLYHQGLGCDTIGKRLKVGFSTVLQWINLYNTYGRRGFRGHYHPIGYEEKEHYVRLFKSKRVSFEQFALQYGIGRSSIARWVLKAEKEGYESLHSAVHKRNKYGKERINSGTTANKGTGEGGLASSCRKRIAKKTRCLSKGKESTTKELVQAIELLRHSYPLDQMLSTCGMARSTYYYRLSSLRYDKYGELKKSIKEIFKQNKSRYGYRRITLELAEQGITANHKLVLKLMREMELKPIQKHRHYRSYKGTVGKVADNVIKRDFTASEPNKKWATDISQINIRGEKLYLSTIIDMYNAEVVSYTTSSHPNLSLVMKMLSKAFAERKVRPGLLIHSDQGWHYQHKMYSETLKKLGITQSMSRKGNCLDNAMMESYFGVMKQELLYVKQFPSIKAFNNELKAYVDYYNNERIKLRLKTSPVRYRILNQNNV